MELLDKNMDQLIDGFLRFCGIDDVNLTNPIKLSLLKEQKHLLEIEVDFFDDMASNTSDKEVIHNCFTRIEANKMVIAEINMCIAYLKGAIKGDKRLQKENKVNSVNPFLKVKSLFLKK